MPSLTALYSVSEIRAIEQANLAVLPAGTLMQRAGKAAARAASHLLSPRGSGARVLVVAGPGNNGGDALESAYLLADNGHEVTVLLFADTTRQPMDAQQALARAHNSAMHFIAPEAALATTTQHWDLVIDGLFGIGLTRPITGLQHGLVEAINTLSCPVLALDVPSGLDADTGGIVGENGIAVRASHTITFIAGKPGLYTFQGRDHAGHVQVDRLDIADCYFQPPRAHLNSIEWFSPFLRPRPHASHKGSYGDVTVIGGAHGMAGAPILAARAAAKCGAGRVFATFIGEAPAYDSLQPELMCRHAKTVDFSASTLVIGPGLGMSRDAHDILAKALHASLPLVLDADALNLIATESSLQQQLASRNAPSILTPHPLEAARMLQVSTSEVQADRLATARKLAQRFNAITVLKGSGSVIAKAEGEVVINTTGNPALATAGTGDVLAGICGALLAQSFPAWNAALAAVWLHGKAADTLVIEDVGPIGLTASELIPSVRTILNRITQDRS